MRYPAVVMCSVAIAVTGSVVVGLVSGSQARAQEKPSGRTERRLERGIAAFKGQDYRRAIRTLRRVADAGGATTAQRTRALELIGLSHLILRDEERAREAFLELVVLDPGFELTDDFGSEEFRAIFSAVKEDFLEHNAPARLSLRKVARGRAGEPVTLDVTVEYGDDVVKEVMVLARVFGDAEYESTQMAPMGENRWRARVKTRSATRGYVLEYYVEGRDIGGRPRTRLGGPSGPRTLHIAGRGERAWYRRWYVVAGGVALVGVTAAITVALARD